MMVVLSSVLTLVVGSGLLSEGAAVGEWDVRTGPRLVVDVRMFVVSLEGGGLVFLASEDVYGVSTV